MKKIISSVLFFLSKLPTYVCCALIRFYQIVISPVIHIFGGGCRFFPTCSQYTLLCIKHHGAIKGIIMGSCRIMRCNPFCKGGLDFPPKKFEFNKLFSQNSVDEFHDFDNKL